MGSVAAGCGRSISFRLISGPVRSSFLEKCRQPFLRLSGSKEAGEFEPLTQLSDRELVQLVCAFRLKFPDAGLVLSTREMPKLRDGLVPLGITLMSAGSHTEPGGYTHQGTDELHRTVRGRIVAPEFENGEAMVAAGQFEISDGRSPSEVATALRRRGFDPVWKDWDASLLAK